VARALDHAGVVVMLDYDAIKDLAKDLKRPGKTLRVLADQNDPFNIYPSRQAAAEWFTEVWERFGYGDGTHARRIHYRLMSEEGQKNADGEPYENTLEQWNKLVAASRDARYLNLVPVSAFDDRRNNEPVIYLADNATPSCEVDNEDLKIETGDMPPLPEVSLYDAEVPQRYHIEIWVEKTTVNDIILPLAERYHCNVVAGAGEASLTLCKGLVDRAEASGRPVRILYISDFDPAGMSMPVAVARKIEFLVRRDSPDLDIQVRPVALTFEQCIEYRLPRTPIKATERRAGRFEKRFGEGATELDALEALHPGELARIVEREISRYYDDTLEERTEEVVNEISRDLIRIEREVRDEHRDELDELESDWEEIRRQVEDWRERAEPLWHAMAEELEARKPDAEDYDWPEPEEGDEDPDPLFDSTRDYVEQVDRYKGHQQKPTERGKIPGRPRKKRDEPPRADQGQEDDPGV
jgi:hypothetical protein